jgi:cytochrome c-type biogenesis protein CcmE
MKTKYIILLMVLAIAIGVIVSTFADASTYTTFTKASAKPDSEFHVIGKLTPGKAIEYDPKSPGVFAFYLNGDKPQDFEKSEQVVIAGKCNDSTFQASTLLLKCPSKYNDEKKPESFGNRSFNIEEKESLQ